MKTGKIIGIITLLVILTGFFYYSNNKNNMTTNIPQITQEELSQGWYWGETKRPNTPDDWTLINAGTRGAKWIDSTKVSESYKKDVAINNVEPDNGVWNEYIGKVMTINPLVISDDGQREILINSARENLPDLKVGDTIEVYGRSALSDEQYKNKKVRYADIVDVGQPETYVKKIYKDIIISTTSFQEGIKWKTDSTQTVSWSIKGLPQVKGELRTKVFLIEDGVEDAFSQRIIDKVSKEGVDSATYKVGVTNVGGDALIGLNDGTYKVIIGIYQMPSEPQRFAIMGDLIFEKEVGKIVVW